jgi:hypothetical protein
MRLIFTIAILFYLSITGQAQVTAEDFDITNEFLLFEDGTLLLKGEFYHDKGLGGHRFYDKQGKSIKKKNIIFFNDGEETYGRFHSGFSQLIIRGHYNVYYGKSYSSMTTSSGQVAGSNVRSYFVNRGVEPFQSLNYKFLQNSCSIFPEGYDTQTRIEVLDLLGTIRKRRRNLWYTLGGAAGAFVISGIIERVSDFDENKGARNVAYGFFGIGFGGVISAFFLPKWGELKIKTVTTYNAGF